MTKNNPINKKTSALLVNDEYSLPTADGNANEVMITDGSGTVTWETNFFSGILVQEVAASTSSFIQTNTTIPIDNTIPQKTEGTEIITVSITPKSSTNILLIKATSYLTFACASPNIGTFALFQDDTSNSLAAGMSGTASVQINAFSLRHRMVSGTTSATTFKLRVGTHTGATNAGVNGSSTARNFGGVSSTIITVQEYSA
jgi:hypothetical protein